MTGLNDNEKKRFKLILENTSLDKCEIGNIESNRELSNKTEYKIISGFIMAYMLFNKNINDNDLTDDNFKKYLKNSKYFKLFKKISNNINDDIDNISIEENDINNLNDSLLNIYNEIKSNNNIDLLNTYYSLELLKEIFLKKI